MAKTFLWYYLALLFLLSLLGQELSRSSALAAADFEINHDPKSEEEEEEEEEASLVSFPPPSSSSDPSIDYCPIKPPSTDYCPIKENPKYKDYALEVFILGFVMLYVIGFILIFVGYKYYLIGERENENIALAFAQNFATILCGGEDGKYAPELIKNPTKFKFRFNYPNVGFCTQLWATMELQSRHSLLAKAYNRIFPCDDEITIEAHMDYNAMDTIIFAIARNKAAAKVMCQGNHDLHRHAGYLITSPPSGIDRKSWVAEDLTVITESKELARHLITDDVLDQVFGDEAFDKFGKGFISMHFSDCHLGSHSKKLLFKFSLPPDAKNMADMTRLVNLVPYYIDFIGRYKLSTKERSEILMSRMRNAFGLYGPSKAERIEMMKEELQANKLGENKAGYWIRSSASS